MIRQALEWLELKAEKLAPTEILGDRRFSRVPLHEVLPKEKGEPTTLVVHSLLAFVEACSSHVAGLEAGEGAIHVVGSSEVVVIGDIEGFDRNRPVYVRATAGRSRFPFGKFMDLETFMINLLTNIKKDTHRDALSKLMGNVRSETVKTHADDGVTQEITVYDGIRVGNTPVAPFWTLRPWRTFREVEQPASEFLLRFMKDAKGQVIAALFEADGAAWELEAIENVSAFLSECFLVNPKEGEPSAIDWTILA